MESLKQSSPELDMSPHPEYSTVFARRLVSKLLYPLTFAVVVLFLWQMAATWFRVPTYLLPAPLQIFGAMLSEHQYFLHHGFETFLEAFVGFLFAAGIGFLLGMIFALSYPLERALLPYAIASQAVPIVAVAPLLILWLGPGLSSKVAMAGLICFFPMVVNSTRGLRAAGNDCLALMHIYGATRWQVFWKLRVPVSVPFVVSGMKISAALAMIGAIVAEYAGADQGLGYVIMQATYRLDTVTLFAGIFYSAFGGWLLFLLVIAVEHLFLRRYRS
jgi:NitT/TauT family transport system permease protein